MTQSADPEFDWSQAASLLGDDPKAVDPDMAAIVAELVESAYQYLRELKGMKAESDRKAISAQAHQLRGSLLNFGFTAVGKILLHIEKGPFTDAEYPGLVEDAEKTFVASKKLLATRYSSLKLE